MKFSFKNTQKRVEDTIALKGDQAPFVIAELFEAEHFGLAPGQIQEIKDHYAKGFSGNRIADLLGIAQTKTYRVIKYERD